MRCEATETATLDPDTVVEHLAQQLVELAGDQSVRAIEALACVLANRQDTDPVAVDRAPRADPEPAECAPRVRPSEFRAAERKGADQALCLCRRVARRAVRRSLADPTGGANAFHRIDANPSWSRKSLPSASVGAFLFYRL